MSHEMKALLWNKSKKKVSISMSHEREHFEELIWKDGHLMVWASSRMIRWKARPSSLPCLETVRSSATPRSSIFFAPSRFSSPSSVFTCTEGPRKLPSDSARRDVFFLLVRIWIRIRVDPQGSALIWVAGSGSAFKMRIWIQEGKNYPQKIGKAKNLNLWSGGCSLLRAEGFFWSLGVL